VRLARGQREMGMKLARGQRETGKRLEGDWQEARWA